MSSVLVKGMKMPENCNKCPMESLELYDSRFGFANGFYKCAFLNQSVEDVMYHGRLSDCPLVELPDKHGRLVDAGECAEYFWEHLDDNGMAGAMNAINEMPTIVESEDNS